MKRAVIIVAGGKGTRMGSTLPKQFMQIDGQPILCRTIEKFRQFDPEITIVISLPTQWLGAWVQLSAGIIAPNSYIMAEGGEQRYHSVKNALMKVPNDIDLIGVHDGVRPLVSVKTIANAYTEAALHGNAVPCIAPPESIRIVNDDNSNKPIDRNTVKLIQTPQVFAADILRAAYSLPYTPEFTDDASVVERHGTSIHLIDGDRQNIKITTIDDLRYADYLVKNEL
jgi:2-C-methyl-D-erythritol 4-phosphate cytidylyltransferase